MVPIRHSRCIVGLAVALFCGPAPAADIDHYGDALPRGAVARLGSRRLVSAGVIHKVACPPDGKTLISATAGPIGVWDAASGQLIRELDRILGTALQSRPVEPGRVWRSVLQPAIQVVTEQSLYL